jgi:hypothetical protein
MSWILSGDLTGDGFTSLEEPNPTLDPYLDQISQRIAYLYSLNTTVTLSVVASGGNLGNIGSDTRMIAGASTSTTAAQGGFTGEGGTPNISSITGGTYARISQTVSSSPPALPTDTDLHRFPIMRNVTGGDLQSMNAAQVIEFFIEPAVALMTNSTINANSGGMYHISTATSLSGSTRVSPTPVFIDTRANASLYTSGGIGETLDQPTTVNSYYLYRVTPTSNTPDFMPVYWDYNGGYLKNMPLSMFDDIFEPMIQNYAVNGSGEVGTDIKIRYNLNGAGSTMGTVMADTRLSGTSASGYTQRFVSASDYRTQEFPNGTPTTVNSYTLKSQLIN